MINKKTTTLTVNRNQVAACALAMAKCDFRYYLNGVKFECRDDGKVIVVGTDGYRLHAGIVGTWEGDKQDFILGGKYVGRLTKRYKSLGGKGYELNAEMTAVTTTTTRPNPDYHPDESTQAALGKVDLTIGIKEFVTSETKITFPFKEMQVTVKPIEGKYPDWRKVIMNEKDVCSGKRTRFTPSDIVNEWVHFNPNYLLDVSKAFGLYSGIIIKDVESAEYGDVAPFGSYKQAIFTKRDVDFLAVVMPIRTSGSIHLNPIDWALGGE